MANNRKPLKITADSSANQKVLRKLKSSGYISVDYINLENAKVSKKIKETTPAVAMWDVSVWDGGDVWASDNEGELDKKLMPIIGKNNYEDRRHIVGHYSLGNDYFVSGDKDDILSNKEKLAELGIKVLSTDELCELLGVAYD